MNPSRTQHSTPPADRPLQLRCLCGATIKLPVPGGDWLIAVHLATHAPEDVVELPDNLPERILLAADAAGGWAQVAGPDLVDDLRMVTNVLAAAGQRPTLWLHVKVGARLVHALRDAALTLSTTVADESVIGELEAAAVDLDDLIWAWCNSLTRQLRPWAPVLCVAASSDTVVDAVRQAAEIIERPLLITTPPFSPTQIGWHPTAHLLGEFAGLRSEILRLEVQARADLSSLLFTACPLPVTTDEVIDRVTGILLDLDTCRLRAAHLAESLSATDDLDVVCWVGATAERIITRTTALRERLVRLLNSFDL